MKKLVIYYSKKGNNKYIAQKIAKELNCDIDELKPPINNLFHLLLTSVLKIGSGLRSININVSDYDQVILCSPIWMGQLISPILSFIKKNKKSINQLFFVTCCASEEKSKDDKFGYNTVFNRLKSLIGNKLVGCFALPIGMILPLDKREDDDAIMNARLNDETFKGEMLDNFNIVLNKLQ